MLKLVVDRINLSNLVGVWKLKSKIETAKLAEFENDIN